MKKIVVIGGGVIGLSIASLASDQGLSVTVVERSEAGDGASGVAAGMLAPVTEVAFGEEHLLDINLRSSGLYAAFRARLESSTGIDLSPHTRGSLYVALDRDGVEEARRLMEFQESLGLDVRWLAPEAARDLEPSLHASTRGAILATGDSDIDPRRLIAALLMSAKANSVEIIEQSEAVSIEPGAVSLKDGRRLTADAVVVAAGAWSGDIEGIPFDLGQLLRPVKGQIIRLAPAGSMPIDLKHVIRTDEVYLVPRRDEIVIGATVEEKGFDLSVTAGGVLELLRAADAVIPGLRELQLVEVSAGLRPATPDNGPLIAISDDGGIIVATGHYRNGVLLAPVTAELVMTALEEGSVPEWARGFGPGRFG